MKVGMVIAVFKAFPGVFLFIKYLTAPRSCLMYRDTSPYPSAGQLLKPPRHWYLY